MTQLDKDREKAAEAITQYVKENGYIETNNAGINEILKEYNASPKDKMYQNPDLCYNRTNAANLDTFAKDIHLFEYLGWNHYRLLGSNYPYTGDILWKPQGSKETYTIGEWLNGSVISWNPGDRITTDKLSSKLQEEVARIESETSDAVGDDKEALVKIRINQGEFRKRLLRRYSHCCLCGVANPKLLIASHIKPWSEASPEEKTDVNNGFLLCPNHDKAFDRAFISFDDKGNILISDELSPKDRMFLNLSTDMKIAVSDANREYIAYHRENKFNKET